MGRSGFGRMRGLLGGAPAIASARDALPDSARMPHDPAMALELLRDFESSGQGWFWSSNAEFRLQYVSECVAEQLGKPSGDLLDTPFHQLFVLERDEDSGMERTLPLILNAHRPFNALVVRSVDADCPYWWSVSGRPRFSAQGEFLGYFGNGNDVTEARRSQIDTSRLARYDSLTGLANRHRISRRLERTLTAHKAAKRSCAVMILDLDRFKQVNDTLGHLAGDDLLRQVAERLGQVVDKSFEIGRLGGDEFEIILPDVDDRGRLGDLAKKIISILSQPYAIGGSRCTIGASIGIAIAPYDGIDRDQIVRAADLALYAAKEGGRGQFRFYSSDLLDHEERRRQIEEDLREALARGQLRLAYQPIVEIISNKAVSLEARPRWEHPEFGEVAPDVFMPLAEKANLMVPMGQWSLRQACADAAQWPGGVRVAVNVSASLFHEPGFLATATQALAAAELSPERLELELDEQIFATDDPAVVDTINALKMLGVSLVVDHFGVGNASLQNIGRVPLDKLKLDSTFFRGARTEGSPNALIVRTIVELAGKLGLVTTAEEVEALDDLTLMQGFGIDLVQGNVYASAVSAEDALDGMASGEWIIEPEGPSRFREERRTVFRRVGLIHEDYRYEVMMRNLSRTGCLIEGLLQVPVGAQFVIDFGDGQLAVATVRRSAGAMQGLEFEMPLVDDGAGGLVTRNRVSPYILASAGMPLGALPRGSYPLSLTTGGASTGYCAPKFAQIDDIARKAAAAV